MRAVLIALATSMVALLRSRASLHLEILARATNLRCFRAVEVAHD